MLHLILLLLLLLPTLASAQMRGGVVRGVALGSVPACSGSYDQCEAVLTNACRCGSEICLSGEWCCAADSSCCQDQETCQVLSCSVAEDYTQRASCKGAWLIGTDCTDTGDTTCENYCSGGSYAGTNIGAPSSVSVPSSSPTSARSLDFELGDNDDRVEITTNTVFNSASFTAMCWLNVEADDGLPMSRGDRYSDSGWDLVAPMFASPAPESQLITNTNTYYNDWDTQGATAVWRHYAVTWNGSGSQHKLYLNGNLDCDGTCVTPNGSSIPNPSSPYDLLTLSDPDFEYDGLLYECAYFNEALSAQDICNICECGLRGDATSARDCGCTSTCQTTTTTTTVETTTTTAPTTTTTLGYWQDDFERASLNPGSSYGSGAKLCSSGSCWTQNTAATPSITITGSSDFIGSDATSDQAAWYNNFLPSDNQGYACAKIGGTSTSSGGIAVCLGMSASGNSACCEPHWGGALNHDTFVVVNSTEVGGASLGIDGVSWAVGDIVGIERTDVDTFICKRWPSGGSSWTTIRTADFTSGNAVASSGYAGVYHWYGNSWMGEAFEVGNGSLPTGHTCTE